MRQTYKSKYGLDFPVETSDVFIDMLCAKKWREDVYREGNLLEPGEHMLRAIRALFPTEWTISPWTEEHVHAWCQEFSLGVIGSAASSKSWDVGGLALLDWLTDPDHTVTIMASTSKIALAERTFASTLQLFQVLQRNKHFVVPGKIDRSGMAIMLQSDGEMSATDKSAIRGIAMNQGTMEENRGSIQGRHDHYVRLIGDELAAMKDNVAGALVDARTNLSLGAGKDFKFVYLANPESKIDVCGRLSEPIEGWASVDENTPRWRTRAGLVIHRNGFQSPAIVEPDGDKKYPYLIRQSQIDKIIEEEHGALDSPRVYTMIIGFFPPTGLENTVLSEMDIQAFHMAEPAVWDSQGQSTWYAGFDPAFMATGGDKAALSLVRIGRMSNGLIGAELQPTIYITISASASRPAAYQVADGAIRELTQRNIPVRNLGVDSSGTQNVAEIIHMESGTAPVRCNFSARALNILPNATLQKNKPRFTNCVTEMWSLVAEVGRQGRLRGMPVEVQREFTSRRYKKDITPLALESKADYKSRSGGRSPDSADAAAIAIYTALVRGGLSISANQQSSTSWLHMPMNIVTRAKNYVDSKTFSGYSSSQY